jgi:hypothetical protein
VKWYAQEGDVKRVSKRGIRAKCVLNPRGIHSKTSGQFCGHNSQYQHCEALATNGKEPQTLDFPRWPQLSKKQKLSFAELVIMNPRTLVKDHLIISIVKGVLRITPMAVLALDPLADITTS